MFYGLWFCYWKMPEKFLAHTHSHSFWSFIRSNLHTYTHTHAKQQNTIFTYDNDWREKRRHSISEGARLRFFPKPTLAHSLRFSSLITTFFALALGTRPLPWICVNFFGCLKGPSLTFLVDLIEGEKEMGRKRWRESERSMNEGQTIDWLFVRELLR